jgi:hypothetical protein
VVVEFRSTTKIGNRDFDLSLSLVVKNSARCNNIIARRGVPIVALGENDTIGTSYYGSWPQSACLLCQNSK